MHNQSEFKGFNVKVSEVEKEEVINEMRNQPRPRNSTFIMVYLLNQQKPKGPKHCVYVKSITIGTNSKYIAECINSTKEEPFILRNLDDKGNKFYRITCTTDKKDMSMIPEHEEDQHIKCPYLICY